MDRVLVRGKETPNGVQPLILDRVLSTESRMVLPIKLRQEFPVYSPRPTHAGLDSFRSLLRHSSGRQQKGDS